MHLLYLVTTDHKLEDKRSKNSVYPHTLAFTLVSFSRCIAPYDGEGERDAFHLRPLAVAKVISTVR
jgi:hypothetical protein